MRAGPITLAESVETSVGRGLTEANKVLNEGLKNAKTPEVIHVTPQGVAIPTDLRFQIPSHYIENLKRTGSYGEYVKGKFIEKLRIDPATTPGMKGPNYSHYHLNGKSTHYSPRPEAPNPGFNP